MMLDERLEWSQANQQALMTEVAAVRDVLERYARGERENGVSAGEVPPGAEALNRVCRTFGLSPFERSILIACAAVELDGTFGSLYALAHGDPSRTFPTFGLALAAFAGAHWSALTPHAPLRRWELILVERNASLTSASLRIDEAILHELAGLANLELRLRPYLGAAPPGSALTPSQSEAVERLVGALDGAARGPLLVQLIGNDAATASDIAAAAFASIGKNYIVLDARALPPESSGRNHLTDAWAREALLHGTGVYLDAHGLTEPAELLPLALFAETAPGPIVVGSHSPLPLAHRTPYIVGVAKPSRGEQRTMWREALAGNVEDPHAVADALAGQFDFSADQIRTSTESMHLQRGDGPARVWAAACANARRGLDGIADRLDSRAAAESLVLPSHQRELLREIVAHARNRTRVYDEWEMGRPGERGLGLSALFYGPSGTGKTLAAEAVGSEIGVDVYRVDLSQLVSKYIGETEKNLARVFDAAGDGGAILLFDECDALFGKRGEVERGQDRYANIEVSYLLQRMEAYRGVAILTTNMRAAIDPAFLRRIRFVVAFPHPDYDQRLAIWERAFGPAVPTEGLDFTKTARLNVSGGNIRNIALHAAFLAAEAGTPVRMEHALRAARTECVKIERAPSDLEIGAWI